VRNSAGLAGELRLARFVFLVTDSITARVFVPTKVPEIRARRKNPDGRCNPQPDTGCEIPQ